MNVKNLTWKINSFSVLFAVRKGKSKYIISLYYLSITMFGEQFQYLHIKISVFTFGIYELGIYTLYFIIIVIILFVCYHFL